MKKQLFSLLAMSSLSVLLAAPLFAQSVEGFGVKIPFEFMIGNRTLPAGEYVVKPAGRALQIRGRNGQASAIALTNQAEGRRTGTDAQMVFHRYGDTYFLSQVWMPENRTGHRLLPSKLERELAHGKVGPPVESIIASGR